MDDKSILNILCYLVKQNSYQSHKLVLMNGIEMLKTQINNLVDYDVGKKAEEILSKYSPEYQLPLYRGLMDAIAKGMYVGGIETIGDIENIYYSVYIA